MANEKYIFCRKFSLTLISAENVPKVSRLFKPRVYAQVSFAGVKKTKKRTRADKRGGWNPVWNHTMKYTIADSGVMYYGLQLVIKFYCGINRYMGETHTSIKELFDYAYSRGGSGSLCLPIQRGRKKGGILRFSYRFGERIRKKKPGLWKRVLLPLSCFTLRVASMVILGVDVPISYSPRLNIVDPDQ